MAEKRRRRVALVTGAAGAIGAEIAAVLAAQGCRLVLHDRSVETVEAIAERLSFGRRDALCIASDLTDLVLTRREVERALAISDGADILVHCAGIASDRRPLEELDDDYVTLHLALAVNAAIALAQLVIGGMKARRFGRLINISSVNGTVGVANASAYNAAKGGLLALSKGWAREFGPWGITANAVAPGLVLTPMTASYGEAVLREKASAAPLGRAGTPAEIAAAVAFLAGDGGAYMTGQVLSPNGGSAIT